MSACRHAELAEIAAGRLDRRVELRRRERARFEQHDAQSARVAQLRLVEHVIAEALFLERHAAFLEPADAEPQFRQHERQRRRRHVAAVQADEQVSVGHDRIRMRPGLADGCLHEAQRFVEFERFADDRRVDADLEKPAERSAEQGSTRASARHPGAVRAAVIPPARRRRPLRLRASRARAGQ